MRALVTGGCGFIGSHVVDALVERGHEVIALDSFAAAPDDRPVHRNPAARLVRADVRDEERLREELRGVDAVSHQAAVVGMEPHFADAPRYVLANDLGTAILLRAAIAAGVPRLVLASSMAVYGEGAYVCAVDGTQTAPPRDPVELAAGRFDPRCARCGVALRPSPVTEDAVPAPRSVYAATKLHQEHLSFVAMRSGGPAVTALRYHNVYGPRLPRNTTYAGVASIFRSQVVAGEAPQVFEDGGQLRDFVHVADVARANVLALERSEPAPGAYNVGSGEPHTVLDLARNIADALGGPPPEVTGRFRLSDVRHLFASSERVAATLGYRATIAFADGMRELATEPLETRA